MACAGASTVEFVNHLYCDLGYLSMVPRSLGVVAAAYRYHNLECLVMGGVLRHSVTDICLVEASTRVL